MCNITTRPRNGIIDGIELTFTISATLNDQTVCTAEGNFISPDGLHARFYGETKTLIDCATSNEYSITVSLQRFTFNNGYTNVDLLL